MFIWLLLLILALSLVSVGAIYMTVQVSKFSIMRRLKEKNRFLGYIFSFLIIAVCFAAVCFFMSVVDAVVVLLSTLMFFLLFGIIGRIIGKIRHKDYKNFNGKNLIGALALIASVIYLCISYYLCVNIWQTRYDLHTDKDPGSLKIAMFADSHVGTTFDGDGFYEKMKMIEQENPDILLIPGDMVDDWTTKENMIKSCEALGKLNIKYGVYFSFGNHDEGYYEDRNFSGTDLRNALKENGVHILEDEYELIDNRFYIVGRRDKSMGSRQSMEELLSDLDTSKYIVVLDHQPADYDAEAAAGADLVVSGHTHGGQLIPLTYLGEWSGINDATYGHKKINGTDFIVTSGISDWAIKFKSGTKSEYVIITVNSDPG